MQDTSTSMQDNCPHLNEEALSRIVQWGGKDMLGQLVTLFLRETPSRLEQVGRALESADLRQAADIVHAMRSSAGNLGCSRLERLVIQFEKQARGGQAEGLQEMLVLLSDAARDATEALEVHLIS